MVLPATGNTISLSQVQTEFGGTDPISLSEYYITSIYGIPTTGSTIRLSDFSGKASSSSAVLPTIVSNSVSASLTQYNSSNYYYYIFTSITGTNTITFTSSLKGRILLIGGGGGGGGGFGGAGGAGGRANLIQNFTFNIGTYTINVGSGGAGGLGYLSGVRTGQIGATGNSTTIMFNSVVLYTATGGTGGDSCGRNFAAARGGSTSSITNGTTTNYSGGTGSVNGLGGYIGGGGAGAGQNGGNALYSGSTIVSYGNGGNGYISTITTNGATNAYYAGGGKGVVAATSDTTAATNGLGQNTYGGGGAGGWADNITGGAGKSGCVIIAIFFP